MYIRRGLVDPELRLADAIAGRVITLAVDPILTTVLSPRFPGCDKTAVGKARDAGIMLTVSQVAVDPELRRANRIPGRVKSLAEDGVGTGNVLVRRFPGYDKAAVDESRDAGLDVIVLGREADPKDFPFGLAGLLVELAEDFQRFAFFARRRPGDDEAAVGKTGDAGIDTVIRDPGTSDLEFVVRSFPPNSHCRKEPRQKRQ